MANKSEAILVIDMLNDFVTGKLRCERADLIIPNLVKLLTEARKKGVPVIYSSDAHLKEDFELKVWGEHAMKGTEGAEVIPELKPEPSDYVFEKRTYSAFFETGLDQHLRSLGVTKLYIQAYIQISVIVIHPPMHSIEDTIWLFFRMAFRHFTKKLI